MANAKQTKRSIYRLQRVKTWQLVVLFVLSAFVAATFLRLNNIGMVERRNAVLAADEAGDDQVTTQRLYDLQRYVSSHMNTSMDPGLYLEASYKRDSKAAYDRAASGANANGNIYKKAQEVCAPQFDSYSYAYLQCTTSELAKYPSADDLASSVNLPKVDSYRHNFISPLWSPDFAGWSTLVTLLIGFVIMVRLLALGVLKLMLKRHYRSE